VSSFTGSILYLHAPQINDEAWGHNPGKDARMPQRAGMSLDASRGYAPSSRAAATS